LFILIALCFSAVPFGDAYRLFVVRYRVRWAFWFVFALPSSSILRGLLERCSLASSSAFSAVVVAFVRSCTSVLLARVLLLLLHLLRRFWLVSDFGFTRCFSSILVALFLVCLAFFVGFARRFSSNFLPVFLRCCFIFVVGSACSYFTAFEWISA
jgi:hypothetical protein